MTRVPQRLDSFTGAEQVSERLVPDLSRFAQRNQAWFGDRFTCPPSPSAWSEVVADPTQRWFAMIEEDEVVGVLVVARCAGPPWRSGEIGFAVDQAHERHGCIQRWVPAIIEGLLSEEFGRLEARVDPRNEPAAQALARLGFRREGTARACLDGGAGRIDQVQWAIVTTDLAGTAGAKDPR